jgi:hypothetical protein
MTTVLVLIIIVLAFLLVRALRAGDSYKQSKPEATEYRVSASDKSRGAQTLFASETAEKTASPPKAALSEAEIAALGYSVRLVNVTPEAEREKLPLPRAAAPVLKKLQGPTADYCVNDREAAFAVERLRTSDLLAIDIETTPKRIVPTECSNWSLRVRTLHPKSADIRLIQVYDGGDSVHIFDLKQGVNLETLRPLFDRPMIAHNAGFEKRFLAHEGIHASNLRCTMQMAKKINPDAASLEAAAYYFLGARLDKSFQKADWSVPELSNAQIKYAACDAWICFLIYTYISGPHKQSLALVQ